MMHSFLRRGATLALAAALLILSSCSKSTPSRVMVLGLDGMDPETVDLLMSEGKLPNLAKIRQEGAYGRLISQKPLLSPIIWTTIATGKPPTAHGIGHFVTVNEKTGEQLPVTSQMRKTEALWNIFSDQGRKVSVVGYWATWPAEKVNGEMVTDHTCYHFLLEKPGTEAKDLGGETYPAELRKELAPLIRTPEGMTAEELAPFVNVPAKDLERPFSFSDDLSHFRWALGAAESYGAIGLKLWQQSRPDLLMVYVEGTDSVGHLFGHLFRAEGLSGELAEQQKRYGGAVEGMYAYADRLLGRFLAAMDDHTTLVVLSDHGFQLGKLQDDPSKTRDMRRVSEQFHREEGILYLYGQHVRRHAGIDRPTILDIAPTLLALAGLAPADDMPGRVLKEALDFSPPARIASYETGTQLAATTTGSAADPAILDHLKSLGYVDSNSPQGERNLAALHFQSGRFAEAEKAYRALIEKSPKDGSLYASLAGALGAQGKLDEALTALDKAITLEPLNPEAYHNRGVVHERRGEREAAIRDYRTAVRYNPRYEPSRQALVRLAGPQALSEPPRSDAERQAAQMAERAADAARRGDYAGAMKSLDEAERIAPRFALVQQYRANVAYLQGDPAGAIAALKRAIEIEPDNALYRANLERLEKSEGGPTPKAKSGKKSRKK